MQTGFAKSLICDSPYLALRYRPRKPRPLNLVRLRKPRQRGEVVRRQPLISSDLPTTVAGQEMAGGFG